MAQKDLQVDTRHSFWYGTAMPFMLGPLDGYAVFPIILFLFHMRVWTAGVLVAFLIMLVFLGRAGYSLPILVKIVKTTIGGRSISRIPKMGHHRIWR